MKEYPVTILPDAKTVLAEEGSNLLEVLRGLDLAPDAPCGGHGSCGKCRVTVNGKTVLSCQTTVTEPMTVALPDCMGNERILASGISAQTIMCPVQPGDYHLAYDIGTTTVVCYLLDGKTGRELAVASMGNPQGSYGADVISRIQHALHGKLEELTQCIRTGMCRLAEEVCSQMGADPEQIGTVSVVGNPCMQQLFFGISPENLATVPFAPVLTKSVIVAAKDYLPVCTNAKLLTPPDISGYVGADTVACLLATNQASRESATLLVDIGTNGEMVLGNSKKMVACSTAAGPALEGAKIRFGMRGKEGAIDKVWLEDGCIHYSVIGQTSAVGICGSGLIDAVAVMLEIGAVNGQGRIQTPESAPDIASYLGEVDGKRVFYLTENVYLTQQDIREVQLAKGAIAAGIEMMTNHLGISLQDIASVQIAGAFGSSIRPESAAKIGLIPTELLTKVTAVGNAAGSGAKLLVCNAAELDLADALAARIRHLELASSLDFQEIFVENMLFE